MNVKNCKIVKLDARSDGGKRTLIGWLFVSCLGPLTWAASSQAKPSSLPHLVSVHPLHLLLHRRELRQRARQLAVRLRRGEGRQRPAEVMVNWSCSELNFECRNNRLIKWICIVIGWANIYFIYDWFSRLIDCISIVIQWSSWSTSYLIYYLLSRLIECILYSYQMIEYLLHIWLI